jgi:hypothetical protein
MSTLAEIEDAVLRLSRAQLDELERFIRQEKLNRTPSGSHGVLDIPPIALGAMLLPLGPRDQYCDETAMREFDSWLTQSIGLAKTGLSTDQFLRETRGEN